MQVTIKNFEKAEAVALEKAIERIRRFDEYSEYNEAEIICEKRVPEDAPSHRHPGWLEYILILRRPSSVTPFIIGTIQRSQTEDFEFHS